MELQQIAQHIENPARAIEFYTALLGAPPAATFDPPGLIFFTLGSVRLLLETGAPPCMIYLKVDDVAATIESLRNRGVEIVGEPQLIFHHTDDTIGPAGADEWMAFIKDSEGNTVGLVSHR